MKQRAFASISLFAILLVIGSGRAAPTKPEDPGALSFAKSTHQVAMPIDTAAPEGLIPSMVTDVYLPNTQGPLPLVLFNHGLCDTKLDFSGWAARIASRGIIVLSMSRRAELDKAPALEPIPSVIDMTYPTRNPTGCAGIDGNVNGEDMLRLLRWALTENTTPGSFLFGKVEPSRLAVAGHSGGGWFAEIAAARSAAEGPPVRAALLLDPYSGTPTELRTVEAASATTVATAVIGSDPATNLPGFCQGEFTDGCILAADASFAALPASVPKLGVRVVSATHGEMQDPDDDDMPPNLNHVQLVERYGMAFLESLLLCDQTALAWMGAQDPGMKADADAGTIKVFHGTPDHGVTPPGC